MTMHEYGIQSWSYRQLQARKNHTCVNCGGVIPKGTTYLRHVVRQGSRHGKDPLRNLHVHFDCEAPWYHLAGDDRCRSLRQLPGRVTVADTDHIARTGVSFCVQVNSAAGQMSWALPPRLMQQIAMAPNEATAVGAVAELQQNLALVMQALAAAAGNRHRGRRVNLALHELQLAIGYTPKTNHDLDPDTDTFVKN